MEIRTRGGGGENGEQGREGGVAALESLAMTNMPIAIVILKARGSVVAVVSSNPIDAASCGSPPGTTGFNAGAVAMRLFA